MKNTIQNFGMAQPGANLRMTPFYAFSRMPYSGGGTYSYFSGGISTTQNASFPNSDDQILKINEIGYEGASGTPSYLTIIKNDEVILKMPLYEFQQKEFKPATANALYETNFKALINPIIINGSDNIKFQVFGQSGEGVLYLRGVKGAKLSAFNFDERKGRDIKSLDYTIFEVRTITASISNLLFCGGLTNEDYYSKQFPLGNNESFQINAIELFSQNTALLTGEPATARAEIKSYLNSLKIIVNSVTVLDTNDIAMHSYHLSMNTPAEVNRKYGGLVLHEPLIIPSNSNVQVSFTSGARTKAPVQILFMLKGVLVKGVN